MFKSPTQPLCRYCGKPISKHVETIYVYAERPRDHIMEDIRGFEGGQLVKTGERKMPIAVPRHVIGTPKTKSDCQALASRTFNHPVTVISVARWNEGILRFNLWDNESYVDEFFCKGSCAIGFAYAAARKDLAMPAYNESVRKRNARG